MATKKTAIAVPEELLKEVDAAARARGESRSRFLTRVLTEVVRAKRDADITRRLDALFADPDVDREQRRGAAQLAAAPNDLEDERW
ncbi:MAG: type II toxin-antitoxin system HicB family antitoxin [Myxococcota bacterium]|nr:type II toxin-antitoxin system HicB family antitoxin [Myxococcota bacterium]